MDELVELVVRRSGVDAASARTAVGVMLRYLAGRLPSPVMGQIAEVLMPERSTEPPDSAPADEDSVPPESTRGRSSST